MQFNLRNICVLIYAIAMILSISGCASMDRTEKGAAIGSVAGAGIGGIIGHQKGRDWEGAAIGGVTGALAGGLIGHQMDKRQAQVNPGHLSIMEIADMGEDSVPASVIIDEIKRTRSVYRLDSETIAYLKNHGINDKVIDYMLSTGS